MSKPLSARLRLMLYEDIALEVEAMENEFTRLTREVEALRELLQSCKDGRSAWSAECERLRDTVVSYLDEIDRLNKVGGSDVDPECDSCAMLRELLLDARQSVNAELCVIEPLYAPRAVELRKRIARIDIALAPAAQGTVLHPSPMNCDHSGSTYEQWTDGSVRFRCPKCGIDFTIRKDQNTDTQGAATPCGRDPCHMGLDGYCAKCHQEAYP